MSLADLIKQKKLNSLARSERATDTLNKSVQARAEQVKNKLGMKKSTDDLSALVVLKGIYYGMVRDYTGKNNTRMPAEMSASAKATWSRVEKARQEAGVDPETFIKAQFKYFDKMYGTYPKLSQLATEGAVQRAKDLAMPVGRVIGNAREFTVTDVDVLRRTESTLQKMLIAQKCTREEFYKNFVLTGIYSLPQEFLDADPAYHKVKNG